MDLEHTPAMKAPSGVVSNLVDPYSQRPIGITLASISLGVAILFVAIRLHMRVALKMLNYEDGILLFAAVYIPNTSLRKEAFI
ncbi:hypothetical protein GGR52DRAFT_553906 [Hypoxylon sp. FL1284]|nr:hypothetical protein GGR52DRAFT_553906 [Hypoxylon sp. FL1284]